MPIESFSDEALKIIEHGPIVPAVIGKPFDIPQPQEIPDEISSNLHHISCLLDTGATNCCINPSFADKLQLPISGFSTSVDASNNSMTGRLRKASFGFVYKNSIINLIPAVPFFELPHDLSGHTIIIGRSLMAKFRALYFCFRTGEYMIHF